MEQVKEWLRERFEHEGVHRVKEIMANQEDYYEKFGKYFVPNRFYIDYLKKFEPEEYRRLKKESKKEK